MGASAGGRLEVVRLLCEAGADRDKVDGDGAGRSDAAAAVAPRPRGAEVYARRCRLCG